MPSQLKEERRGSLRIAFRQTVAISISPFLASEANGLKTKLELRNELIS